MVIVGGCYWTTRIWTIKIVIFSIDIYANSNS